MGWGRYENKGPEGEETVREERNGGEEGETKKKNLEKINNNNEKNLSVRLFPAFSVAATGRRSREDSRAGRTDFFLRGGARVPRNHEHSSNSQG